MVTYTDLPSLFTAIANAIRGKTGSSNEIVADDFPTAIAAIPSGGGGSATIEELDVSASGTYTASGGVDGYSPVVVPAGTAGTPSASKGTVSNHAITVTPSVTNDAGFIAGGTINGTGVSVSASELVSGNKEITANGTNIDVVNYSTVSVSVSGGKAIYVYNGCATRTANSYAATDASVTVTKAGTYNISFMATRSSSQGTMGTNLYINGTGKGANATFNKGSYGQYVEYTDQTLAANSTVTVYATSGSTSRSLYISNLIVEEQ